MGSSVTESYFLSKTQSYNGVEQHAVMHSPDTQFGQRFQQACRDAGLPKSQNDLGKVLGVSGATISNYRNGEKLPSMPRAIEIATKTGVCVEWLLTGRGPKTPQSDATEGALTQMDISHLPSESRALLRALRDTLSQSTRPASNHDD